MTFDSRSKKLREKQGDEALGGARLGARTNGVKSCQTFWAALPEGATFCALQSVRQPVAEGARGRYVQPVVAEPVHAKCPAEPTRSPGVEAAPGRPEAMQLGDGGGPGSLPEGVLTAGFLSVGEPLSGSISAGNAAVADDGRNGAGRPRAVPGRAVPGQRTQCRAAQCRAARCRAARCRAARCRCASSRYTAHRHRRCGAPPRRSPLAPRGRPFPST